MSKADQKKADTIAACLEIAARYRADVIPGDLFDSEACPLCNIHRKNSCCKGCPLADKDKDYGCVDFDTYQKATDLYDLDDDTKEDIDALRAALERRAQFFDRLIPILEGLPASQFTRESWKYLDIPRNQ